jgi:Rieske Fe-S protein
VYAMSSRCTHKGTTVGMKDGKIRCPAHGSVFSEQGTPTGGPAKSALTRFGISLNDKGHLIVDRSKQFSEQQWDDPAAFVNAKQTA